MNNEINYLNMTEDLTNKATALIKKIMSKLLDNPDDDYLAKFKTSGGRMLEICLKYLTELQKHHISLIQTKLVTESNSRMIEFAYNPTELLEH